MDQQNDDGLIRINLHELKKKKGDEF